VPCQIAVERKNTTLKDCIAEITPSAGKEVASLRDLPVTDSVAITELVAGLKIVLVICTDMMGHTKDSAKIMPARW
jgi:hypothetical protein